MAALTSPRAVRRKISAKTRNRALSQVQTQESHDAALISLRSYLKDRICYEVFPVSFRLIVLDSKLEVKKALQCFLLNGKLSSSFSSGLILTLSRCCFRSLMEQ
jgi:hypothetical protein